MELLSRPVRAQLKRIPLLRPLVRAARWCIDPHLRSIWHLQRKQKDQLFQPSPTTKRNRYPAFFDFVRAQLADVTTPRILSYGCSTGEEVFSLHHYFPGGFVTGIDINPNSIKLCRRRLHQAGTPPALRFICAGTPAGEGDATYDAIFCMAVLRHGGLMTDAPANCAPLLDFTRYEALVTDLARCLKIGGYIVFWNTHFRFADTQVSAQFDVALTDPSGGESNFPLYCRDNMRLDVPSYDEAVFVKRC